MAADNSVAPGEEEKEHEKSMDASDVDEGDIETKTEEKLKYPTGVWFILGCEFCERFSYYGMRAILVIYLVDWLGYTEDQATAIYHAFVMLCYFTPIFGAMMADGWIGKYKTILWVSMLYACGNITMSLSALPPAYRYGPMLGLLIIALGTGGIKPCVSSFGGDQFRKGQEKQQEQFFSVFYLFINIGSILSMLVTPLIRSNVFCFGGPCWPVAFGIPAILMIISIIFFVGGSGLYRKVPPEGNVLGKACMCIGRACVNKMKKGTGPQEHWLDYANDKYEQKFIEEVKPVVHVLLMYIPLPVFWALFEQQGSRWTFQARQMDTQMGADMFIPPEEVQSINPFLILCLVPIFEKCIYPLCAKCRFLTGMMERMVWGMICAGLAFTCAAFLQMAIDDSLDNGLPAESMPMRFINAAPCDVTVQSPWMNDTLITGQMTENYAAYPGNWSVEYDSPGTNCEGSHTLTGKDEPTYYVTHQESVGYYGVAMSDKGILVSRQFEYHSEKSSQGGGICSFILGATQDDFVTIHLKRTSKKVEFDVNATALEISEEHDMLSGTWRVTINNKDLAKDIFINPGAGYVVIFRPTDMFGNYTFEQFELVPKNSVSVWWQVPQYVIMTTGEVLFSISGLAFSYSQAPQSMKVVLMAGWLLTDAFGNLLTMGVTGGASMSQVTEFFFFAILMYITTIIFGIMACFYKPVVFEAWVEPGLESINVSAAGSTEKLALEGGAEGHENPAFETAGVVRDPPEYEEPTTEPTAEPTEEPTAPAEEEADDHTTSL